MAKKKATSKVKAKASEKASEKAGKKTKEPSIPSKMLAYMKAKKKWMGFYVVDFVFTSNRKPDYTWCVLYRHYKAGRLERKQSKAGDWFYRYKKPAK